ncbi:hypothetical protein QQ045_010809 [Rhodiola kirilowii]
MEGADLIWNKISHPRHSFCAWLAFRNRLPTKDNLKGIHHENNVCSWCQVEEESERHLFFNCTVLRPLHWFLNLINITACWDSWEGLIYWFKRRAWGSKAEKTTAAFIINAAIYETWRARNQRIFKNDSTPAEHLIKRIWNLLRLKLELIKNTKHELTINKQQSKQPVLKTSLRKPSLQPSPESSQLRLGVQECCSVRSPSNPYSRATPEFAHASR